MKYSNKKLLNYLDYEKSNNLLGLCLTSAGFSSIKPSTPYPSREHPSSHYFNSKMGRILHEYQLIYISQGEGYFESSNCPPLKIQAGTIILLFPNEWHNYKPSKDIGWDEYWIGFKGSCVKQLLESNAINKEKPVHYLGLNDQIIYLFKQILDISITKKNLYQQLLSGIITHLISYVFYLESNNLNHHENQTDHLVEKAKMIIRRDLEGKISLQEIAKSLNLSYSWFRRIFKTHTGYAPAQYVMELKLQKSKELLKEKTMSIKEIALTLNFLNVSYFVSFFKSKTGLPPGDYRNKMLGNYK